MGAATELDRRRREERTDRNAASSVAARRRTPRTLKPRAYLALMRCGRSARAFTWCELPDSVDSHSDHVPESVVDVVRSVERCGDQTERLAVEMNRHDREAATLVDVQPWFGCEKDAGKRLLGGRDRGGLGIIANEQPRRSIVVLVEEGHVAARDPELGETPSDDGRELLGGSDGRQFAHRSREYAGDALGFCAAARLNSLHRLAGDEPHILEHVFGTLAQAAVRLEAAQHLLAQHRDHVVNGGDVRSRAEQRIENAAKGLRKTVGMRLQLIDERLD